MKKLRVGFIGCGRISSKHFEALSQLKDKVEVIAVCDIIEELAADAGKLFKCNFYTDILSLLANETLDLTVIATPNGLHPQHAIACARHGVDVLCEKPMSVSDAGASEIVAEFKKLGRNFFLIHQNRYNEPVAFVKKAIKQERFGKIYMMTSNVFWQRPDEYYSQSSWHGTKELDGGTYMTQASHYVDMLNWFANSKVDHIYSTLGTLARNIETEDSGSVVIKWSNGIIGNLNATVLTYPKNYEGSITILGEKGTVKIGGVALNKIEHCEFANSKEDDKHVSTLAYATDSVYGHGHVRVYEKIIEFYNNGTSDSLISLDGAYSSFKLLDAILESHKQKKPIYF